MLAVRTREQVLLMITEALGKEKLLWRPLKLGSHIENLPFLITSSHRSDILEWMLTINTQFHFYPEAYSLAAAILDKFISLVKIQAKYLKCAALTCLNIAAKITEEDDAVPHIADFVSLSGVECSVSDVVRMEVVILSKLDWNVILPTPLQFLQMLHAYLLMGHPDLLSHVSNISPSRHLTILTHKLHLCLLSLDVVSWSPSVIAASLLSLELEHFRSDWLPLTLGLLGIIKSEDFANVISCKESLAQHLGTVCEYNKVTAGKKTACNMKDMESKMHLGDLLDCDDICDSINMLYNDDLMDLSNVLSSKEVGKLLPED